ncbi:MAG: hypothetical protein KBT04_02205 [Bacteroidales bacterium]|nr:hypothetical protein [Candidatus Colimorpha onthohippi]
MKNIMIGGLVLAVALVSCQHRLEESGAAVDTCTAAIVSSAHDEDTMSIPSAPDKPQADVAPKVKKRPVAKTNQKTHTFYVSSYDSKGEIWGHVTLQGDKGSGTLYDSGENTYSVTCTRHGNELYAVDQNSRQYVFKIPNN